MARFYADEQFPRAATDHLRLLGHDVLTVQEAGNANQKIPDDQVLAYATADGRVVLTINRQDFIRLHKQQPDHSGIIACTENRDYQRLAAKINEAVSAITFGASGAIESLNGQLLRITRDAKPSEEP
jgi:predicted nuclease of predicted toxin-antitoxin system